MLPKESPFKMFLETHTTTSSTASSTKSAPSSLYSAPTPSTAPSTPAIEREDALGAALQSVTTLPTAALAKTAQASTTTGGARRHPLSPMEREYDPSRDDLPLDELLARPRLPRSPYEIYQKRARVNGRTMKPLKAAVAGASRVGGEHARPGEDFEKEKERVRALGLEMGMLKLPPKKE
jgi:hypothetical protein